MAQTVSMQRGTSTVAYNSQLTLFTNSSSVLATRVIVNMISYYGATYSGTDPKMHLTHTSSSGGSAIIGYNYGITAGHSHQMMPANNGISPLQINDASTRAPTSSIICSTVTSNYMGVVQPNNTSIQMTTSANNTSYLPSNFWIGPSDVVKVYWYDSGGVTQNVAWSFTLISES